jgi:hypothetical protein
MPGGVTSCQGMEAQGRRDARCMCFAIRGPMSNRDTSALSPKMACNAHKHVRQCPHSATPAPAATHLQAGIAGHRAGSLFMVRDERVRSQVSQGRSRLTALQCVRASRPCSRTYAHRRFTTSCWRAPAGGAPMKVLSASLSVCEKGTHNARELGASESRSAGDKRSGVGTPECDVPAAASAPAPCSKEHNKAKASDGASSLAHVPLATPSRALSATAVTRTHLPVSSKVSLNRASNWAGVRKQAEAQPPHRTRRPLFVCVAPAAL